MAKNETKAQRRERAREAAAKLREEEKKRTQRNRLIAIIVGIVVVALVGAAIWYIVSGNKKSAISDAGEQSSTEITTKLPQEINEFGGISIGKELAAGTSNSGVPRVSIYFDYLCSHCTVLDDEYAETLRQMAQDGKITLEYYPTSIYPNIPFSADGQRIEFWIAEHAPDKYLDFHNKVFADITIPLFAQPTEGGVQPSDVSALYDEAKLVGLSDEQVAQMKQDIDGGAYKELSEQALKQFTKNGFTGTPTILINGKQYNENWANGALLKAIENAK